MPIRKTAGINKSHGQSEINPAIKAQSVNSEDFYGLIFLFVCVPEASIDVDNQ